MIVDIINSLGNKIFRNIFHLNDYSNELLMNALFIILRCGY
jgi:hypothetical protein